MSFTTDQSISMADKCIQRDLKTIKDTKDDLPIIFANSIEGNALTVEAAIDGPLSTPYENGVFLLRILFSDQHPFSPPKLITFERATMHPNINEYGAFMSEMFSKEHWTPTTTIKDILEHVWIRLAIPNIDVSECDQVRAQSYKTDKEQFERQARDYSIRYAAAI